MFSATPAAVISSETLNGVSSSLFISERTSESAETVCANVFSLSGVPSVEPFLGSSPSLSSSPSEMPSSSVSYLRGSVPWVFTSAPSLRPSPSFVPM